MEEYLTIAELAARLKLTPKTIKNKMASGVFKKGVHYFSRSGLGPRFEWSAVVAWLKEKTVGEKAEGHREIVDLVDGIPLKRGSVLRIPLTEKKRRVMRADDGL